ncbi:MAG TPA: FAD-dependent oxidoreductase [Vicinamibacterales bacterium]|nr:FAD-dependent oxidoreductase [Vicinamibacterales bacterium]
MRPPSLGDRDLAFPRLTPAQVAAFRQRGHARAVNAGDVLFAEGDRGFCFYVVLAGAIEIVEHSSGAAHTVVVHQPQEFTGDVDMLSGRSALVTARAAVEGEVLEVSAVDLRHTVDELPELGEIIVKAFLARRSLLLDGGFAGIRIIGSRFSPDAHRLRDFATRNAIPFTWIDLESDAQAEGILRHFNIPASATPVVIGREGRFLRNPSIEDLARCAGLDVAFDPQEAHDLIVVGGGPAGLAAALYGASEGLDVVVLEAIATGGQAGTSSRIENYLGFPAGISGAELTGNALVQAQRFGARITVPRTVARLGIDDGMRVVTLVDGTKLRTRTVLIATGVRYRRLDVPRFGEFEGAGIYYAATEMEARFCRDEQVVVVGAGNSAGQAIVYLAELARDVHVVVRGDDLATSMSRYLVDRVEHLANVHVHRGAVVTALDGEGHLAGVRVRDRSGTETTIATTALFLFIGADPNTRWLSGCVELDSKSFVVTGPAIPRPVLDAEPWRSLDRQPFLLETSLPGVFAAGDVRSGSIKRCASAVGEGSIAVSFVHAYIGRTV